MQKLRKTDSSDSEQCESGNVKKARLKKMTKFYAKKRAEKTDDAILQFSDESDFSLPEHQMKSMKIESSEESSEIGYNERPITKVTWEISEPLPVDKKPKVCPRMCKERIEDALITKDEKRCKPSVDKKIEEIYRQSDRQKCANARHASLKDRQKAKCYCKPNLVKNAVKMFSRRNYQTLKNDLSDSDCSHIPMDMEKDLFFKKM